jgi:DNA end-binding protein Ku
MTRPVWTGSISFGLVNVPVKAYTAVRDHTVHFHQLEQGTGARIHHQNISEKTGEAVEADQIVSGYEISKGQYVTFARGELEDLRPASTRAIEVSDFVALDDVDPIYYERTYWLGPADDAARQAYGLLAAAMAERGRVAIGSVVMRNKQYLAAIRPLDGLLAMSTMRFADEVVPKSDIDELPARAPKADKKALTLALQIVDSLAGEWDPERYHDTYTEELRELIKRKEAGEEMTIEAPPPSSAKVIDLMAALEASVAAAKGKRSPKAARKALSEAAAGEAEAADADNGDDEGSKRQGAAARSARSSQQRPAAKRSTTRKTPAKRSPRRPRKSA